MRAPGSGLVATCPPGRGGDRQPTVVVDDDLRAKTEHLQEEFCCDDVLGGAGGDDGAIVHHDDLVAVSGGEVQVVVHHDDGAVQFAVEAIDQLEHVYGVREVEERRWFVQQDDRRLLRQGRDPGTLPLPTRKFIEGAVRAPSVLATAVDETELPDGDGYVWFAGEASVGLALRKRLRWLLPANRLAVIGYWRDDKEAWLDRYEQQSAHLIAAYERVAATGMTEAEAELHWDELLERAGL